MYDDRPVLREAADPRGRTSTREADCFSDEIVVDFPSIAPLVARMREAFVEPDAAAVAAWADVSVTPREARRGCRKPVGVTLRVVCRHCGGRGETWTERCPFCTGTGASTAREVVSVPVPAGVRDGARLALRIAPPDAPAIVVSVRVSVA